VKEVRYKQYEVKVPYQVQKFKTETYYVKVPFKVAKTSSECRVWSRKTACKELERDGRKVLYAPGTTAELWARNFGVSAGENLLQQRASCGLAQIR